MAESSSTLGPSKNLRDALLDGLRTLAGTREFHIHVLESSPRRNTSLYQFAKPRPRTYVQDILVLLSEKAEGEGEDRPRVLVTAMEASLYILPGTGSGILYVCKVDSTGQSSGPSPTKALVGAFLKYYGDKRTRPVKGIRRLWIQLFARAQGQYLFPNSSMWEGKKPLGDVKLCGWWKRVLGQIGMEIGGSGSDTEVQGYYVLPGYGELEAECTLKVGDGGGIGWSYGHPYGRSKGLLPCPGEGESRNLGHYIPYFEDDPKSRFLDEIAYNSAGEIKSPARKRTKTNTGEGRESASTRKEERALGELGKVTPDEFWERMSFRQECVAGAVTGFFCVVVCNEGGEDVAVDVESLPGQVSSQVNKRVLTALTTGVEFSTPDRAVRATDTIESTVRRLCQQGSGQDDPYHTAIYGSLKVHNAAQETARAAEPSGGTVRVLAVRKKRK